jgi:uroporphyrinogen decarboxylase
MQALAKRYPSIAALTAMDLSIEAEAFGSQVKLSDTEAPTVIGSIVADMAGVEALQVPAVGTGRTAEVLRAVSLAADRIIDRPVFGGLIGPFSLGGRLMDMTKFMVNTRREPETVQALLEKCTEFLTAYALAFKAAGANGIIIAEPAAGLISPAFCQKFSSEYVKRIVDAVQDEFFTVILHNCGNTEVLVNQMLYTGAKALHFGNVVDMTTILSQLPKDVIAFGNVDPLKVMKLGSVYDVKMRTLELLEQMSKYPNFVLSTGCETPPGVPVANVDAFFKTLEIFNATQEIRHKWLFDKAA